ncbi:MAG: DUF1385 domain-containing protein [Chloroflexi bacterium HGW-Chloroflexi-2]|jgi:uncharacterized protein YqhQ|nr:MAG: DUF1385 domain-containing protein [Chloroflexi bacterium HGW-Chloroflexi-2]
MKTEKLRLPTYGGQALIEGVLMRGSNYLAAAYRKPDGEIIVETEELGKIYQSPLKKIPFLRGLIILWDALGLGTKYLTKSANFQTEDEKEKIEGPALYLTLIISLAVAMGLFFLTPALLAKALEQWLGFSHVVQNLIEGLIRLVFVIAYIWGIGKMSDIKRVFSYHGAEHKTINAFEAKVELSPEIVKQYSLQHPRCGTAFILYVVLISVIMFTFLGDLGWLPLIVSRLVLIPVIAMIAYEFIRFTADHLESPIISLFAKPGLWLQKLTTNEPDEKILEVSIAAFNAMYKLENKEV